MTNYWMLEVREQKEKHRAVIAEQPTLDSGPHDWLSGEPLSIDVLKPLEFKLGSEGKGLRDFFPSAIPLMSVKMLKALSDADVNNIESYPAMLIDSSGLALDEEFCAINILGKVSCADLNASDCEYDDIEDPIGVEFDSLVIDEDRTEGRLLFRLYESANGIVVHDSIRRALEPHNFRGIVFVKPEDWIG